MNILVIGNGFDLAHGLPTKYTNFLEFIKVIRQALSKGKLAGIDWGNTNEEVKNFLISNKGKVQENLFSNRQMWEELIDNNFWMEYFLSVYKKREKEGKNGWIDFESEISKVIQSLDGDMQNRINGAAVLDDEIDRMLSNDILELYTERYGDITFKVLRDLLLDDLNKLIRALEIYLSEYVEKMEIQEKSPDIDDLEIDFILSFNYTHIFTKLYDVSSTSKQEIADLFDYIHGEADINNTVDNNNMVLGIDEYLPDDRKNKDIEFIAFKKFYQRIYKGTGSKYKDWINAIREENNIYMERKHDCEIYLENIEVLDHKKEEMRVKLKQLNENPPRHNLYIFGHSLDVTDKDILRELILNDNVYTTIFYHDKDTMGQQIANLVKVIGQDELIRRTGGSTKTIEFKLQQDMIPIQNQ